MQKRIHSLPSSAEHFSLKLFFSKWFRKNEKTLNWKEIKLYPYFYHFTNNTEEHICYWGVWWLHSCLQWPLPLHPNLYHSQEKQQSNSLFQNHFFITLYSKEGKCLLPTLFFFNFFLSFFVSFFLSLIFSKFSKKKSISGYTHTIRFHIGNAGENFKAIVKD